jgi:hypothetical protein
MDNEPQKPNKPGSGLVGLAVIALCVVGVGGALEAIVAATRNDFIGVGACLTASALGFGLLLNAFLRS